MTVSKSVRKMTKYITFEHDDDIADAPVCKPTRKLSNR